MIPKEHKAMRGAGVQSTDFSRALRGHKNPTEVGTLNTSLRVVVWGGVVILAAIGITTGIGRAYSVASGGLGENVLRQLPAHRVQEGYVLDRWFLGRPLLSYLHVVPGAVFLALAPLQFSSRIRNRYLRFHRWSGRLFVAAAIVVGLSGLVLGAVFPFGGPVASAAVFVAGPLFLFSLVRAVVAIRRGDVVHHREWMIRMFSLALGIATVRLIAVPLLLITDIGLNPAAAISFWAGWLATFTAGEFWIRYTRPHQIAPGVTMIEYAKR